MNISNKTIESIKQAGYPIIIFYDTYINEVTPNVAVNMQVTTFEPYYKSYNIKSLKKEITLQYVLEHIAKKDNYNSIDWNAIFKPLDLNNVGFYTTSYGLGVEVIFGHRHDTINKISDYLNGLGIKFENEYSDAYWVYRFKISKAKDNIDKIAALSILTHYK